MTYKQACTSFRMMSTNINYSAPDWPEIGDNSNITIVSDGADYAWFKRDQQTALVWENRRDPFSKSLLDKGSLPLSQKAAMLGNDDEQQLGKPLEDIKPKEENKVCGTSQGGS